ncbi:MAG TPA: hypothetical protein VGL78_15045 [Solirubrobacteraceae bacterium]|jgi:hypothetical protein
MTDAAGTHLADGDDGVQPSPDTDAQPALVHIPDKVGVALFSTIGLNTVSGRSRKGFALTEFAESLNGLQDAFEFTGFDKQWNLDEYDELHIFTNEHYYDRLRGAKAEQHYDYAIAITSDDLEQSVFNVHREGEGIGIITVSHYEEYLPPGGSFQRYLAFLVLCETLCLAGKYQFEHSRQSHCLFDMCENKHDLIACLSRPQIELRCERNLRKAGFGDGQIEAAYAILRYVGSPSWTQIAISGVREPGAGFALGVATTLAAAIIISASPVAAEAVCAGAAMVWLVTLYVTAVRGRPRMRRPSGRLRRFRIRLSRQ